MSRVKDRVGIRYGRLIAQSLASVSKSSGAKWLCLCDCGNTSEVFGSNLQKGHTKSCGCLELEGKTKHGMHGTKVYGVWQSMLRRCGDVNNSQYSDYGGRGIAVCEEWKDFDKFYEDMGEPKGLTIDRLDNNDGYHKDNCKWATRVEQQNNKRNNRLMEYDGKTQSIAKWADDLGIKYITLISRLNNGWSTERALTQGVS